MKLYIRVKINNKSKLLFPFLKNIPCIVQSLLQHRIRIFRIVSFGSQPIAEIFQQMPHGLTNGELANQNVRLWMNMLAQYLSLLYRY